jgi:glycosyltransferase involved in cell wall biosynthesis
MRETKTPLILAHDYLIQMGGAERVVASMSRRYPEAPIYTSAVDEERLWPEFRQANVKSSWMKRLPGMPGRFKQYFPLYPQAFRSFGKVDAEVAWISASGPAKSLRLTPGGRTVCYCYNPTRYLWQTEEYVDGEIHNPLANLLARAFLPWLRRVDLRAAKQLDTIVSISHVVRERIRLRYKRDTQVVYPPVEVSRFQVCDRMDDYHLVVSRLLRYKRIDVAVDAFNRLQTKLVVVGEGPDRARLESLAGRWVTFAGRLPDEKVQVLMQNCRGLIFPGEEDFGITPVEAMACGKPVIAWARGGAMETVKSGQTGLFYMDPTGEALAEAVKAADAIKWDAHAIRRWADTFGETRFHREMQAILEEAKGQSSRRSC